MIQKIQLISIFFLTLFTAQSQDQISLTEEDEKLLDSLCQSHLEDTRMPGMAIGVIGKGRVLYAKGFGVKKLGSRDAITSQSIFHMASVSKTFVATAIAQLISEGKIDLNDRITEHLPYFELRDARFKEITIKHLITHTSGIPDVANYHWRKPKYDDDALENYVKGLKRKRLNFAPGRKFKYSNTGFNVLGDLISKVSGMSFEDYMTERIFRPIGMSSSTFYQPEVSKELATSPHVKRLKIKTSKVYPYNREHVPSGTLNSNVEDMLKYALTYLQKGSIENEQVFEEHAYSLLTTPLSETSYGLDIGLSWFINKNKRKGMISHGGQDTGYLCYLYIDPAKSWALVILYNGDWKIPFARQIFDTTYEFASKYE